jgi:hypothetical protein
MIYGKRALPTAMTVIALLICVAAGVQAASQKIPPHQAAVVLFDGSNLNNFDTFFEEQRIELRS